MDVPKDKQTDWTLCEDGTKQNGSVKRAVDEFAKQFGLSVTVTTKDDIGYGAAHGQSWYIQKVKH